MNLLAASFSNDFAVVFIDEDSEVKAGAFPLNRSLLARAIQRAGELEARGVVVKLFLDQPTTEAADASLERALTNLPVIVQARIDDQQPRPNPLPDRFFLSAKGVRTPVEGTSGWIPLPRFSKAAADVGFVDFASTNVPLLEIYRERAVKSLIVCCIELATSKGAVISPGKMIRFGDRSLGVDAQNCVIATVPQKDDPQYIPFHKFLAGEISRSRVKGRVVIIGYDGRQMHSLPTAIGPMRAHRVFVYALQNIYERLGE